MGFACAFAWMCAQLCGYESQKLTSGVFLYSSPPFYFFNFFFFLDLDLSGSARIPGQWALDTVVSGIRSTGVTKVKHYDRLKCGFRSPNSGLGAGTTALLLPRHLHSTVSFNIYYEFFSKASIYMVKVCIYMKWISVPIMSYL